jgi:hypothetical protein
MRTVSVLVKLAMVHLEPKLVDGVQTLLILQSVLNKDVLETIAMDYNSTLLIVLLVKRKLLQEFVQQIVS